MGASGEVWAPENEIHLFHAMQKYKPVGMHKHVRMFNIHRFVNEHAKAPISVEQIWERINDMYDIQLLDELVRGLTRYPARTLADVVCRPRRTRRASTKRTNPLNSGSRATF